MKSKLLNSFLGKGQNGSGLVEVLVALAILSMTMISVVGVTTTSLRRIKRDEVKDRAIGIQFRGLEFAKSPISDIGLHDLQNIDIAYYSLSGGGSNNLSLNKVSGSQVLSTTNCNDQSAYYIDLADFGYTGGGDNAICNQLIIEFLDQKNGVTTYQITSLLAYNVEGETEFNELIGFRREK